ncbi:MAG: fructose-bisphosphate aldolase class I [Candidatus Marinimicrobia bacterium]|nr:fructose-bisphosphate aldolase class I [Candidatus Neomarinimicrobiota bacterium]|tara:strand:- start:2917 stop:3933 length:1017 start_codon:yes stop_codon:yes gene_type:complete
MEALNIIANKMVAKGKGILAADESTPTCSKRFESIGVESTYENRNEYRDMLLTTEGLNEYISGVIMFDETLRQSTTCKDKIPFTDYLDSKGILPGIKVDTGAKEFAGFTNEKITEGLDGLRDRLKEYYKLGARFAKWRAVITIGDMIPSDACIYSNAHGLARYASLCQENGLVPIVEPEILMNGSHTIEDCYEVSQRTLNVVFEQLIMHHVLLDGIVLKPNMIISGLDCNEQASVEKVSELTFKCLKDNVPSDVPGIAFLSGGQSSDLATAHLNTMNEKYIDNMPWNLTFSYGRALQEDALKAWAGSNRLDAQKALMFRSRSNSLATKGMAADMMQNL